MKNEYGYGKELLKGLSVGPFLRQVKTREQKIAEASSELPETVFQPNRLAAALHPSVQFAWVSRVTEHDGAKSFVLVPDVNRGTESLAYFRAGQYVSVLLEIGEQTVCKPYTIRSAPASALGPESSYILTVKRSRDGFASRYILDHWTVGSRVTLSGPLGEFYFQGLRDEKQVIGLAGGSGVTPFCSMAAAIADGTEDFRLTLLYGSRKHDGILLGDELLSISARSHGRVKVVNVLSDDDAEGFEHGLLSAELIRKYAPADRPYSVFVCGPRAMYDYEKGEIEKLGLPKRLVRFELSGEYGDPARDPAFPREAIGRDLTVTVLFRGQKKTLSCPSQKSLLRAMEEAGIAAPSDCRSGICGWCRSRLVSGEVFMPEEADGRRAADRKFGWIHPCAAYPLTDVTLEVFPLSE